MNIKQKRSQYNFSKIKYSQSQTKLSFRKTSNLQFSIATGKRIKTQTQLSREIKLKRVNSHKKISFSIRKMDQIFNINKKQKSSLILNAKLKIEANPQMKNISCKKPMNQTLNRLKTQNDSKGQLNKVSQSIEQMLDFNKTLKMENQSNLCFKNSLTNHFKPSFLKQSLKQRLKTENDEKIKRIQKELIEDSINDRQNLMKKSSNSNHKSQKQVIKLFRQYSFQKRFAQGNVPGLKFKKNTFIENKLSRSSQNTDSIINSSYLHLDEVLTQDNSESVAEMYQIRSSQNLLNQPKQWHFYDCLALQKLSLYKTNLKISCESWILIDRKQLKFLRAWCPKSIFEFNPMIKFVVSIMVLNLSVKNSLNLKNLKVRVNNQSIENKMYEQNTREAKIYSLFNHTIISLWDLFIGMIVTQKIDIVWHIIYVLGYLYQNYAKEINLEQSLQFIQNLQYIHINGQEQKLRQLEQICQIKFNQSLKQLGLVNSLIKNKLSQKITKNTKLLRERIFTNIYYKNINDIQLLQFSSTPLDISILLMSCMKYKQFNQIFLSTNQKWIFNIKFQVGFHYWQNRTHSWSCHYKYLKNQELRGISGRNIGSGNECVALYDIKNEVISVLGDCKVNMHLADSLNIRKWMKETFSRFKKLR